MKKEVATLRFSTDAVLKISAMSESLLLKKFLLICPQIC